MFRRFLFIAIFATSAGLFAQRQSNSTPQAQYGWATQPSSPSVIMVPSSPSVYVVGGGLYGTGIYLVDPWTLPVQNTGISLGGREGISLEAPLQTGALTAAPWYGGWSTYSNALAAYSGLSPYYAGGTVAETDSGRMINDMGPSYYVNGDPAAPAPPVISLGEVAVYYKTNPSPSVRTFTMEDAHRLSQRVTIPQAAPQNPPQQEPPQ
jgi:hypothetical protein